MLSRSLSRPLARPLARPLDGVFRRYIHTLDSAGGMYYALSSALTPSSDFDIQGQFSLTDSTGTETILSGTTNGTNEIVVRANGTTLEFFAYVGTTLQTAVTRTISSPTKINSFRARYVGTTAYLSINNGSESSQTWALNGSQDIKYIGARAGASNYLSGSLLSLKIWDGSTLVLSTDFNTDLDLSGSAIPVAGQTLLTRASTATYWNKDGILATAAVDEPRFHYDPATGEYLGLLVEGAATNKCINYNANPVDLTSVTKSGDAAATLTVVDDSSALAAAGLDQICSGGKVYKLDNSLGVSAAFARIEGGSGNTNTHSLSVYARKDSGTAYAQDTNGGGQVEITSSDYQRFSSTYTPGANRPMGVNALAGTTVYFILNQLEEVDSATSVIVVAGSSATRAADVPYLAATNMTSADSERFRLINSAWVADDGSPTLEYA